MIRAHESGSGLLGELALHASSSLKLVSHPFAPFRSESRLDTTSRTTDSNAAIAMQIEDRFRLRPYGLHAAGPVMAFAAIPTPLRPE